MKKTESYSIGVINLNYSKIMQSLYFIFNDISSSDERGGDEREA